MRSTRWPHSSSYHPLTHLDRASKVKCYSPNLGCSILVQRQVPSTSNLVFHLTGIFPSYKFTTTTKPKQQYPGLSDSHPSFQLTKYNAVFAGIFIEKAPHSTPFAISPTTLWLMRMRLTCCHVTAITSHMLERSVPRAAKRGKWNVTRLLRVQEQGTGIGLFWRTNDLLPQESKVRFRKTCSAIRNAWFSDNKWFWRAEGSSYANIRRDEQTVEECNLFFRQNHLRASSRNKKTTTVPRYWTFSLSFSA